MRIIKDSQLFFHRYLLKKQLKSRRQSAKRKLVNLDTAKTVGILFDATELDDRNVVLKYAKALKDQGKRVRTLGYFDNKLENENFTFSHFNRKKLDWALRPTGEAVMTFMKEQLDLLLTIDPLTKFHMEYIAALSNAHLKVGPYTDNTYCYDLMIDAGAGSNLHSFINQIEHLLKKTNVRHEAAQV